MGRLYTRDRWSMRAHTTWSVALGIAACVAGWQPTQAKEPKQIIGVIGFPCGLNGFTTNLCAGFEAGKDELPPGYTFELKSGVDFTDTVALNNLYENSIQLNPVGLIAFPNGPVAQAQILKQACAKGIKVIVLDNKIDGLGQCQSSYIASDSYKLGAQLGEWLIAHPPSSKEVGIVTFPPDQFSSAKARVEGFTETVKASGYEIVATVNTDTSLDKTRTIVTNMITAHPNLGAIMSSAEPVNNGTALAITDPEIVQLTVDGVADSAKRIQSGERRADALQNPFDIGRLAVLNMGKLLQGESIPAEIYPRTVVLDKSNVDAFVKGGVQAIVAQGQ